MNDIEGSKHSYWNHYLDNKKYWGQNVTIKRLEKVKPFVWEDRELWVDILLRHSGLKYSPEILQQRKPAVYKHMIGNLAGMIYQNLLEQKIIKS